MEIEECNKEEIMGIKLDAMIDDDFDKSDGNWFEPGVYKVLIESATRGKTDKGTEYIEFKVLGEEDQTGKARKYITEKSAQYTRNFLAGIAVHNQTTEEEKQKVRDSFKKPLDTDTWTDKYLEKFKNFEAWIDVYEDENAPKSNGGFYKRTEIFHYEPKHRQPSSRSRIADMLNQATPVELSDDIPFN